ncbi:MAG: 3'-5' exonuclease [bacterium]|nr:3'-5' exonuclease [bacterium]
MNDQDQDIGREEETRWKATHGAIKEELVKTGFHFNQDRKTARRLTSELVAASEEDQQLLANDEAVAHGLTRLRKGKSGDLETLLEQPYFARVVTREEGKEIEFRLGTASFPKERIVDWRKGPISQLYYSYREGEDFSETIQGRDREGTILLRRGYQGIQDALNVIDLPDRSLYKEGNGWKSDAGTQELSRPVNHDGHLPPILSLITPEQFQLITSNPQKPMVIQGIAGSGKTTVALHRLAWLLHEDNAGLDPQKTVVIMFNRALKNYVETTLPELNIEGVPILTYSQWIQQLLNDLVGPRPRGLLRSSRPLEMFKSSSVLLDMMKEFLQVKEASLKKNFIDQLFQFFEFAAVQEIFWPQWKTLQVLFKEQAQKRLCDLQDDSILCHLIYAAHGCYPAKSKTTLALLDHIVIDEAQDFGVVEVTSLLNALDYEKTVTIVGDSAQRIVMGRDFKGWQNLLRELGFEMTEPITLNVSYRTTEEIMKVATHVRADPALMKTNTSGRTSRTGPEPGLQKIGNPSDLHLYVAQWIKARLEESQKTVSAIICRWPKQAEQLVAQLKASGHSYVRLGHRDQFDFSPGVIVTNVHQVKGLEFRNVLIVEPTEENYHLSSEEERNRLAVGITRAEVRLDFISSGRPTDLLPPLLKK